jgi:ATP-dependent helicase HrpB
VLVFLPGRARSCAPPSASPNASAPDVEIAPLYGALDPREQDRAIAPAPRGKRKVVLATSIAETSLTIQGVRVVIDAGLARVPRFDPASGLTRLATVRVSRAAADQRRGRAGRTEPGPATACWDEAETRALPAYADPEILDADLSGLALDLARWGRRTPGRWPSSTRPPAAAFAEAPRAAVPAWRPSTADACLTAHGRALADMPLQSPASRHMVLKAADTGQAPRAARIAALISRAQPRRPRRRPAPSPRGLERDRAPAPATPGRSPTAGPAYRQGREGRALCDGLLLAFAYPERIARARGPQGEFQLVSGRGAFVEPTDALARETWLAVAELGGASAATASCWPRRSTRPNSRRLLAAARDRGPPRGERGGAAARQAPHPPRPPRRPGSDRRQPDPA